MAGGGTATKDLVPNRALREAVVTRIEAGELSWSKLARDLGFMRPDTVKVKRILGVVSEHGARGSACYNVRCSYTNGLLIAEAADLDPVEVEL